MTRLIDAIVTINPNAEVSILDNDYDKITWHNIEPIDKATLDAKVIELQAEADAKVQADKDLKASAKAKLIAGEALTEAEADTIVL
nr:hypothetical protein [uncultured Mediterranean phage uvMED]